MSPGSSSVRREFSAATAFRSLLLPTAFAVAFVAFVWNEAAREALLQLLFPGRFSYIYERVSLAQLFAEHVALVAISSALAALVGITLGVFVTRPIGRDFQPIVQDMSSVAQTFPPVAVLALAVPAIGFGFAPSIVALFVYSILPILNNTISGLDSVDPAVVEASRGVGMKRYQTLLLTELPLAARVIAAGVRTSVVINVGTATVGAVVGAGGLGTIIVSGLVRDNAAYVFSGAITAAFLALSLDFVIGRVQARFYDARTS